MAIMRKQKVNRYTTVDNFLIDDKRLDPEGKGYLIYMLRKPDNWKFNYKSIQNDLEEILEGKIKVDGSLVLKVYYSRNIYKSIHLL